MSVLTTLPKRLRVTVTAADATAGARHDCAHCPLALALQRQFPLYTRTWRVKRGSTVIGGPGGPVPIYLHSRRLKRAIQLFDRDGQTTRFPGTFILTRGKDL